MKVWFIMFVSDGRMPEMTNYPKGLVSHMADPIAFQDEEQCQLRIQNFLNTKHPWAGCYHAVEVEWDQETGEIS